MENQKIRIVYKKPGYRARVMWIENTLEWLQRLVGGYIETVKFRPGFIAICNEEGRLLGLPWSCSMWGVDFVGPVIFCGTAGEEFADIDMSLRTMREMSPDLFKGRKNDEEVPEE